jgi:nucleoside-diphosphate-sugar epimerase
MTEQGGPTTAGGSDSGTAAPAEPGVIALTGATGFIGGALARALVRSGKPVRALIRRPRADLATLGVETVVGSLADAASLRTLVGGANVVVHCAAILSSACSGELQAVNVDGTIRLLEAAKAQPSAPRFLLISSLAAREPHISPYAASKQRAEQALRELGRGIDRCILRPPAVYGPGDQATLPIFRQFKRRLAVLPASPDGRFSLIYIDDLIRAVLVLLGKPSWSGEVIELDDGHAGGYSWRSLLHIAGQRLTRTPRPVFAPRLGLWLPVAAAQTAAKVFGRAPLLTTGKLRELFHRDWVCRRPASPLLAGWSPQTQFKEGFATTWQWYAQEGLL